MQEHSSQLRDVKATEPPIEMEALAVLYSGIPRKRASEAGEPQVPELGRV